MQEQGKLARVPRIHTLKESAPRRLSFEQPDFERVQKIPFGTDRTYSFAVTLSYTFGWRMQSEVLAL